MLGLRGTFGSTKYYQVDQDQHQYDKVEAYPVGDRSAIEHYAMLAYEYGRKETAGPSTSLPGFPMETRGVEHLHAALSTESRTSGRR